MQNAALSKNYYEYTLAGRGSGEGEDERPCGDERAAEDLCRGEGFAEEEPGEEDDEGDAELIDRGDAADRAELQGAKVAEPRETGAEAGENEEEPAASIDGAEAVVGVDGEDDGPGEDEDDGGADGGGEVAVNVLDADFGEEGCAGGEDGGEERPGYPGHAG